MELASSFEMDGDFARNVFLILKRMFIRKLRAEFEERFPGVGSFAMNAADEANQLVPGLAVRVTILAGVNSGELPLVFSRKRIDSLGQAGSEGFQLIWRAFSRAGLQRSDRRSRSSMPRRVRSLTEPLKTSGLDQS